MHDVSFEEKVELITAKDPRYHRDAYSFVREALDHTQKALSKANRGRIRHITGQELLDGIREYALTQFGPMTVMVLQEWGIRACRDFGEIVFNMVETGGASSFATGDLKNPQSLASILKAGPDPISQFLWDRLSEPGRQSLQANFGKETAESVLLRELTAIIKTTSIYHEKRFARIALSPQAKALVGLNLSEIQRALFNRILLEDVYPEEIVRSGGLLAKTESDSRTDFEEGYDFHEAFRKPFLPLAKQGDRRNIAKKQPDVMI